MLFGKATAKLKSVNGSSQERLQAAKSGKAARVRGCAPPFLWRHPNSVASKAGEGREEKNGER